MKHTLALLTALLLAPLVAMHAAEPRPVHLIPNFHPASCGWLTDWSTERNYCANTYFLHLDRALSDTNYTFALSECNNMIAMLNFRPERVPELKRLIAEGRVDLCNGFFLEPTINLSGGEALVKMGVEGLRWQQAVFGVRPRTAWMIDVTGTHEQMAQITPGLGLEGLVCTRYNPTDHVFFWSESPEGSRVLTIVPGHYSDCRQLMRSDKPLTARELADFKNDLEFRAQSSPLTPEEKRRHTTEWGTSLRRTPAGAPMLLLAGAGDYSLPPKYPSYPAEFLKQFRAVAPQFDVRCSTTSRWLDEMLPGLESGAIQLETVRGCTEYGWNAFWIQCPRVKVWYRRCEQQLQAAEMLATAASLRGKFAYPVQALYHGWLQMLLNMDRNTLWGAAGGMVFEHPRSWDARDRFEWVERQSRAILDGAARDLAGKGDGWVVFNPLNWRRSDSVRLARPIGPVCQALPGRNEFLSQPDLPSVGIAAAPKTIPLDPKIIELPPVIETQHYRVKVDAASGALTSLKLKSSDEELLGGPANAVVAEQWGNPPRGDGHQMGARNQRRRVADSNSSRPKLTVTTGPLATVVEAESDFFGGGKLRRTMFFCHDSPRIEFETELNDIPNATVVVAEFPLASAVREVRRGIPYGFSHAAWAELNPALPSSATGIQPAIRWSHYQMAGAGVALLDLGLTGREITGNTPILFLYNAVEKYMGYTNAWLSGVGRHVLRYALVAHAGDFATARIPQMAWEFNHPPMVVEGCAPAQTKSFVQTSGNVVVEAMRREGGEIELRLAECFGNAGEATVQVALPCTEAFLTDMTGGRRQSLGTSGVCKFPIRPQQIVTLRFKTADAVPAMEPLTEWDELVPEKKREALRRYLPDAKGHPPRGGS